MPREGGSNPATGRDVTRKQRRRREREAKKAKRVPAQRVSTRAPARSVGGRMERAGKDVSRVPDTARPSSRVGRSQRAGNEVGRGGGRGEGKGGGRRLVKPPAVSAEEREVSRLERLLKMKRRKNLPTAFRDDGLDYLLNLTDQLGSHRDWNDSATSDVSEPGMSSGEEPVEAETKSHRAGGGKRERSGKIDATRAGEKGPDSKKRKIVEAGVRGDDGTTSKTSVKRVRFQLSQEEEEEDDSNGSLRQGDGESVELENEGDSDGYIDDSGDSELEEEEEEEEEDSEGSSGEDVAEEGGCEEGEGGEGKGGALYLPPHLRDSGKGKRGLERLQRALQGIVNRLSESNVQSICKQLEQIYSENSRNDMNSCLTEVLLRACVSPALLSERFAMLHAMVVAILHSNIGSEVGAYMIQALAQKLSVFLSQSPTYGSGKECNCVLLLISHLYNFKVVHCILIYDIIRKLVESFTERDVELLLLLLKNTGMEIRRDDATSLKDIILQIESKAASSTLTDSARARFMLETLSALKTNNSRKIPNHDPSLLEHMRRLLRGLVRSKGPADENQLKISLKDLLLADSQGRWWVIGSAWTGRESSTAASSTLGSVTQEAESWVLDLARQQRMNTDIRKNIFCVLMTSEDCVDAFEKLLRLGLKDKQEREIIHVLVDCCLQERKFNPYYAFLGQKFCEFNRTHQVTFQYALWDRLKALSGLSSYGRSNLCQLVSRLVTSQALSLAVLRVVEFTELGKEEVKFYKKLLHSVMMDYSEDTCKAVFSRLTAQPHLKSFRDSLLVFVKHFISPKPSSSPPHSLSLPDPPASSLTKDSLLRYRLQLVEQIMRTPQAIA